MDELISVIPLADLGATGLLVVVVVMILTGRLVPKSVVDARVTEAHTWRDVALERGHTNDKLLQMVTRLAEVGETGVHALASIPPAGEVTNDAK